MLCKDSDDRQVEAWQIPSFGDAAAEDLPDWLVERLIEGTLEITDIGGVVYSFDINNTQVGLPGDFIVRYKDDTILFCSNTTFLKNYQVN